MSLLGNLNTTSQVAGNIRTSVKQTRANVNTSQNEIVGKVNKSIKQVRGCLNVPIIQKLYLGIPSTTATVTVNNNDSTVKVDVKKVPNSLIINTPSGDIYNYDGSEQISVSIPDTSSLNELTQQVHTNTQNIRILDFTMQNKQDILVPDESITISDGKYIGTTFKSNWFEFEESDWIDFNANEVRLNITQSEHLRSFPVIDTMLIYNDTEQCWDNNIPVTSVLPNNTLVIRGTEKVKCKILLKGENL